MRAATENSATAAAQAPETRSWEGREAERKHRTTDGKGGMRRHKANSAVGAREVQLSSTDPRSARCGGDMLGRSWSERVCGFQRIANRIPVA